MPIFKCEGCGCVENTATSRYWIRGKGGKALCSECDPKIGKWHGIFTKRSAKSYMLGNDGFLYSKEHIENGELKWRIEHQGFEIIGPA